MLQRVKAKHSIVIIPPRGVSPVKPGIKLGTDWIFCSSPPSLYLDHSSFPSINSLLPLLLALSRASSAVQRHLRADPRCVSPVCVFENRLTGTKKRLTRRRLGARHLGQGHLQPTGRDPVGGDDAALLAKPPPWRPRRPAGRGHGQSIHRQGALPLGDLRSCACVTVTMIVLFKGAEKGADAKHRPP